MGLDGGRCGRMYMNQIKQATDVLNGREYHRSAVWERDAVARLLIT
jgi:hypothetical protein